MNPEQGNTAASTFQQLPDPGPLQPHIDSFELDLRARGRARNTIWIYLDATRRLARWLRKNTKTRDWARVTTRDLKLYMAALLGTYPEGGYANNQYRAIQQFWKFWAAEEEAPNPMIGMSPPKPGEKLTPVVSQDDLARLLKDAEKGRDFESRRDAAIMRLFACTGMRLSELAMLEVADLNLTERKARIVGKGNRERQVMFDAKAAQAIDRYLRIRARHRHAASKRLWLGVKTGALQPGGIQQMVQRRGLRLGLKLHPHMFRHTFSHNWLDAGGAEGDLMELNGWNSPQMLRRYGASARAARAHRAYDRVDVMRGA